MEDSAFQITFEGQAAHLAAELEPLAESAVTALKLTDDFSGLRICGDDLPGQDDVWYRLRPAPGEDTRPILVLFCHGASFQGSGRIADAVRPPRPVWEQMPAPRDGMELDCKDFSRERSAIFLHHHLLAAQDMVRGRVRGRDLPAGLAEAFAEAWAVGLDGRLARKGLPCYPLAERRARFARVFSPAGILLPDHWQVFQSLWDGALTGQKEVLDVVKRLPGL